MWSSGGQGPVLEKIGRVLMVAVKRGRTESPRRVELWCNVRQGPGRELRMMYKLWPDGGAVPRKGSQLSQSHPGAVCKDSFLGSYGDKKWVDVQAVTEVWKSRDYKY